jgi:DNA-binding SARP family transcriptional activator
MTSDAVISPSSDSHLTLQTMGGARLMSSLRGESEKPLLDGGKPVALIAYLASAPSRQARRDQLVDLLWSDLEPDAAKHALRQTLWYIKKRVGDAILLAAGDTLSVSDRLQVDRDVLLRAAEQNDHEGVLAAYTGDFLPDFAAPGGAEFEGWADVERRRLRSLFHRATEASVRELLGRGRGRDAVARARRARDLDPTHQSSWRLLLEALIAAQDWAQAQGEGEALERMVAHEEVELEPASRSLLRVARQGGTEPTEQGEGRRGIVAELVGREREFALLLDAASQAQRGRGEHVHLRAPAGIGKSRLLGDLMARLRSARARVVLVRCDVGSRELPYAAASELALMLGRLPGARGVSPDSAAALVAMAPALSTFFTVPHDPSTDQEALRRRSQALLELATAVSEEQALVVLIDDVHWMDARSRTVLGQLATRVHALHLLIVTTGRPVVEGRLDDPEARVVELPVLTELQCAELVASIATLGQAEWGGALYAGTVALHRRVAAARAGDVAAAARTHPALRR